MPGALTEDERAAEMEKDVKREKAAEVERVAFHSRVNIRHKDQLALFVPASFIALLGTDAGIFQNTHYHVASSKLRGKHK